MPYSLYHQKAICSATLLVTSLYITLDFSCYIKRQRTHRQTRWPALHAVFLTALVGGHGLVGRRSAGLRAEGILGEFLKKKTTLWIPHMQKKYPNTQLLVIAYDLFVWQFICWHTNINNRSPQGNAVPGDWILTVWHVYDTTWRRKLIAYCTALCHS